MLAKAARNNVYLGDLYTSRQKTFIFVLVSSLTFISLYSNIINLSVDYKYEELIGLKNDVIELPYYKTVGNDVLFNKFELTPTQGLYIDHIKVFDTKYKKVVNSPLSQFNDIGDWEVVLTDTHNFPQNIILNKQVVNAFTSSIVGKYLVANRSEPTDTFELEITFDCTKARNFKLIESSIYYKNDTENDVPLFYSPGCELNTLNQYKVYRFPLYLKETPYQVIMIKNFDTLGISKIQLFKNGNIIEDAFLKYPKNHPVVAKGGTNRDYLTVYNTQTSEKINIIRDDAKIDLGDIASDLVKLGQVSRSFLIWSDSKNVLLRNNIEIDFSDK
jgi:hypothetical protein